MKTSMRRKFILITTRLGKSLKRRIRNSIMLIIKERFIQSRLIEIIDTLKSKSKKRELKMMGKFIEGKGDTNLLKL
jgi:hypothetical protein